MRELILGQRWAPTKENIRKNRSNEPSCCWFTSLTCHRISYLINVHDLQVLNLNCKKIEPAHGPGHEYEISNPTQCQTLISNKDLVKQSVGLDQGDTTDFKFCVQLILPPRLRVLISGWHDFTQMQWNVTMFERGCNGSTMTHVHLTKDILVVYRSRHKCDDSCPLPSLELHVSNEWRFRSW